MPVSVTLDSGRPRRAQRRRLGRPARSGGRVSWRLPDVPYLYHHGKREDDVYEDAQCLIDTIRKLLVD